MGVGLLLAGILFIWLTARIPGADSNATAGLWLGVLLAGTGMAGIILTGRVVTTVDPAGRRLRIECSGPWGTRSEEMLFDDVACIRVAGVGSRSPRSFWLQIEIVGGKRHSIGRWSGNEEEMNRLAARLCAEIGCDYRGTRPVPPASTVQVLLSASGAVILYAAWFRATVGPWCEAMWFGTAPPVILLTAFALLLSLIRRLMT